MKVKNVYSASDRDSIFNEFTLRGKEPGQRRISYAILNRNELELAGTPFLYSVFHVFSTGNYSVDYRVFRNVQVICYLSALLILCLLLEIPPLLSLAFVILFTNFFFPFELEVTVGNVNGIQLLGLSLMAVLLLREKSKWAPGLAGLMGGFLLAFKPNVIHPLVFATFTLYLYGKYSQLKWFGIGLLLATLIAAAWPWFHFGSQCTWWNWYPTFKSIIAKPAYRRSTLVGYFFNNGLMSKIVGALATLFGIAFLKNDHKNKSSVDLGRPEAFRFDLIRNIWIGFAIYVIAGPLSHQHYFIQVIPLVLYLFRGPNNKWWTWSWRAGLKWLLVAVGLFIISFHPLLKQWGYADSDQKSLWLYTAALAILMGVVMDPWVLKWNKRKLIQSYDGTR